MAKSTSKTSSKVDKKAVAAPKAPISSATILQKAEKKSKGKAPAPKASGLSDSDDSDDSDDSEEDTKKPIAAAAAKSNGKAKTNGKPDESSDESSEESSSEDEKPKTSQIKAAPAKAASESSSDSDSDSSDSDEDSEPKATSKAASKTSTPAKKATLAKASSESSSSDSDSDSDNEAAKSVPAASKAAANDSSSDSSDDSSSDEDVEMADASKPAAGKRKSADDAPQPTKKVKLANGDAAAAEPQDEETKSIFVGRLSWNVDDAWLAEEFASCGEVTSATVQMDRNTGKSRGFGYVHFASADSVSKALEMNGKEIDGRPVNIDKSNPPDPSRAREARAKTFGDSVSAPSATLFVGNLPWSASEDSLWEVFGEFGSVKTVRLPTDRESGKPKGFGYVEFDDQAGATKAMESGPMDIDGRTLRLDYSTPRDSSGGGRGGGRGGFGGGRGGGFGGGRGGGFGGDRGRGGFRGRGGDRGGRGGGRGRGAPRGGSARSGAIGSFEGKKTTFD